MSSATNPSPGTPEDWLRHAKSDLAVARGIQNDPDVLPNQTVFHAQQAAEKAIKAVMIREAVPFPRTHDLTELVKRWTVLRPGLASRLDWREKSQSVRCRISLPRLHPPTQPRRSAGGHRDGREGCYMGRNRPYPAAKSPWR